MKKVHFAVVICLIALTFSFVYKPFELKGKVSSPYGVAIPNCYVQIWERGDVIAQTKTNNKGEYTLPLSKIGEFNIMIGNKNKFFHPKTIKQYSFHTSTTFEENYVLDIDKQELQEEITKLRESYRHMIHNRKNMSYRRAYLSRFPKNGSQMELFFGKNVNETNLKKEANRYIHTMFQTNFAGNVTYMVMFIKYSQRTDVRYSGKVSQKFYDNAIEVIKNNHSVLFKELEACNPKQIKNFFVWMFSGGSFGKQKMATDFDYLAVKFPREYALLTEAFELYRMDI